MASEHKLYEPSELANGGALTLAYPNEQWLNSKQATLRLGISNNRLHSMAIQGRVRCVRVVDTLGNVLALYVHAADVENVAKTRMPRNSRRHPEVVE